MQKPRLNLYKDLYRDVLRWRSLGLPEDEARKLCLAQYKSLLGANFNLNKASKEFERAWTSRRKNFPFTDLGNAERIAYDYGRDLRYCHQMKKWLIWRGTRWEIDDSGGIDRRAKRAVRKIYAEASQINDGALRKAVVDWARQCESRGRISAMIALARSDARIPVQPEELDADPWLLNCQNGTLDLKASKLLPHDRDHLLTKITPVKYDPDAKCGLWKEFLLRIMGGMRG